MRLRRILILLGLLAVVSVAVTMLLLPDTRQRFEALGLSFFQETKPPANPGKEEHAAHEEDQITITPQAQANLRLVIEPAALTSYWRTLSMPGQVVELPGASDRGITTPVAGVISKIHRAPWETVRPGDELFTLRLNSEFLQASQTALFKSSKELQITQDQRARLNSSAKVGAVPAARLLELDYQEQRLNVAIQGSRHELAARGLTTEQIDAIAQGKFLTHLVIRVPEKVGKSEGDAALFEVQELKVSLGEQVSAGQLLCYLTDHQHLYIEGQAFKGELALLERAARQGTNVKAEWLEEEGEWTQPTEPLQVRFLANVIDPRAQTFPFYIALRNQFEEYTRNGKSHRLWRYRPGQRVRIEVPVEEFKGVYVVPVQAVVRDGAESYVFRQNGDVFERCPIQIRFEDAHSVVLVNDGSVSEGQALVKRGAAALNRALKAKAGGGEGGDEHEHHHHHH